MNRLELKNWRRTRQLTQPELARMLQVNPLTIWRWESGDTTPPPFLDLALETLDRRRAERLDGAA